jgi:hypothetical protein
MYNVQTRTRNDAILLYSLIIVRDPIDELVAGFPELLRVHLV